MQRRPIERQMQAHGKGKIQIALPFKSRMTVEGGHTEYKTPLRALIRRRR